MINTVSIYAISSILLIPSNIYCAYWMFRVLFDLSGITLGKMISDLSDAPIGSGKKGLRQTQRLILRYMSERSSNPKKTQMLFCFYIRSSVLCFLGKILLDGFVFSEKSTKEILAALGIVIFMAINILFVLFGIKCQKICSGVASKKNDHPQ